MGSLVNVSPYFFNIYCITHIHRVVWNRRRVISLLPLYLKQHNVLQKTTVKNNAYLQLKAKKAKTKYISLITLTVKEPYGIQVA